MWTHHLSLPEFSSAFLHVFGEHVYEFMLFSLHLSWTTRPIKIKLVFNTKLPGLYLQRIQLKHFLNGVKWFDLILILLYVYAGELQFGAW